MSSTAARTTQGFLALRCMGFYGLKALLLSVPKVTFLLCTTCDISILLQQQIYITNQLFKCNLSKNAMAIVVMRFANSEAQPYYYRK